MEINYAAVLLATILQFLWGAVWYTFIFGNAWRKIHSFDKHTKEEQEKMMKGMAPFYAIQFFITLVSTFVFALFAQNNPHEWNIFGEAGFFWVGFVVPTQISAVIFGGTENKSMVKKIAIMAGGSLVCFMIAATIIYIM